MLFNTIKIGVTVPYRTYVSGHSILLVLYFSKLLKMIVVNVGIR